MPDNRKTGVSAACKKWATESAPVPGFPAPNIAPPLSARTPPPPRPSKTVLIQDDGDARLSETPSQTSLPTADWRDDIFAALNTADIRQVGYVPDAGHSRLIELCEADPAIRTIRLTSEEEGIGLAAGAWLGGQRAALLMQSSGVGNCVNLLSLAKSCRFPLIMLVTMRGEWGEFNPWQVPMGTKTQAELEFMDVLGDRVDRPRGAAQTRRAGRAYA